VYSVPEFPTTQCSTGRRKFPCQKPARSVWPVWEHAVLKLLQQSQCRHSVTSGKLNIVLFRWKFVFIKHWFCQSCYMHLKCGPHLPLTWEPSNPFIWSVNEGSLESGGMIWPVTLRSLFCSQHANTVLFGTTQKNISKLQKAQNLLARVVTRTFQSCSSRTLLQQLHWLPGSLQTDNHASTLPLSFLQAGCPSCRPTNSVKALKAPFNTALTSK